MSAPTTGSRRGGRGGARRTPREPRLLTPARVVRHGGPGREAVATRDVPAVPIAVPRAALRWWPLAPIAVALVALLVYANALGNGFALDDGGVIRQNPLVTQPSGIWRAFANPYWPTSLGGGQYRPLGIASFSLDWWLSGGSATWMHAVNMLLHAAAAVLVWLLAAELLAPAGALAAGLLFAVHPVHVEAVANTVGRLEPMAAIFVLGALLAHRRRSTWSVLLFALGMLAKENAAVFPALALASDLLLGPHDRAADRVAAESTLGRRRAVVLYAAYAIVLAAYAAALLNVFHGRDYRVFAPTFIGATTGERLLTVASIIPHYARLLTVPFDLSADYYPQVIRLATSLTPLVMLGLALLAGYVAAIVWAWRRERSLAFALIWVPIALAPVSNVFFPSVALAERTLYLPSAGACLVMAWLLQRAALRLPAPTPALVAAGVLLFALTLRTWTRTPAWRSDKSYLLTLLRDHPESYRAHLVAGRVLAAMGNLPAASREYAISRDLWTRDPVVYRESAMVAQRMGARGQALALADSAAALSRATPAARATGSSTAAR